MSFLFLTPGPQRPGMAVGVKMVLSVFLLLPVIALLVIGVVLLFVMEKSTKFLARRLVEVLDFMGWLSGANDKESQDE